MLQFLIGNVLTLLGPSLFGWSFLEALSFFWAEQMGSSLVRAYWFRHNRKHQSLGAIGILLSLFSLGFLFWGNQQALPSNAQAYWTLFYEQDLIWFLPLFVLLQSVPLWQWQQREILLFPEQLPPVLQVSFHPLSTLASSLALSSTLLSSEWQNPTLRLLPLVLVKTLVDMGLFTYLKRKY